MQSKLGRIIESLREEATFKSKSIYSLLLCARNSSMGLDLTVKRILQINKYVNVIIPEREKGSGENSPR